MLIPTWIRTVSTTGHRPISTLLLSRCAGSMNTPKSARPWDEKGEQLIRERYSVEALQTRYVGRLAELGWI